MAVSGISSTRQSSGPVQDSNSEHLGTKPSTILLPVGWVDCSLYVRVHDLARDGRTEFLAPRTFQGNGVLGNIVDESPTGTAFDANGRKGWVLVLVVVGR